MAKNTSDDPRDVPILGWCAECLREATWLRAATMWQGTALCAQHLLYSAGTDLEAEGFAGTRHDGMTPTEAVVSRLREQLNDTGRTSGF
ncbi:hypothetical protein OG216_23590 [Streptomycetaceae bacterium NBC_01309]